MHASRAVGEKARPGPKKDGRRERSARTHKAIVAALLDLVAEGSFEPTAQQIADRAGVALRSIRQHFASREELFLAAVEEHGARVGTIPVAIDAGMSLAERIAAFAEVRGRELELSSPIRSATSFLDTPGPHVRASSAVATAVETAWRRRRKEVSRVFATELALADDAKALLDAVDLQAHGRTWDTMRQALGLSPSAATATMRRCLTGLLSSTSPPTRPRAR